jgi:two-component system sensor histidine kinase KdpD
LATAKAALSGLADSSVTWSAEDQRELLSTAGDALDRLTDLVTNLLDLSRLQADVLPVLARPMAVADLTARALDQLAIPPGHVRVQIPDDLPDITADAGLLERVLANLIQNAVRFSPDGTPVDITASAAAGKVEIRVIDRGPGIKPEDEQAIFAAFQRRDDQPLQGAGVGLGLAIARGFTEAMGGAITTEQTPGGGATFVVQLAAENATAEARSRREP